MDIQALSNSSLAGGSYSIACTVVSDFPSSVAWLDPCGTAIDNSDPFRMTSPLEVNGNSTSLVLNFDPLKISYSGLYTCVSTILTYMQKIQTMQLIVECKVVQLLEL